MQKFLLLSWILLIAMACDRPKNKSRLSIVQKIQLAGDVKEGEDISAVALVKGGMFIGSDEKGTIQFLTKNSAKLYEVAGDIVLAKGREIDIEAMTTSSNTLYILGSHSYKRKKVKDDKTYTKNRKRLASVEYEASRDAIYKVTIDDNGRSKDIKKVSLRGLISKDKYLRLFEKIPSKENGVDIEGLAYHNGKLYAGFRGPVFRGNYAPVLIFTFDKLDDYEIRFVNLVGHGIRDIQRVKSGFLILSGPVGDAPESGRLYFWDGKDGVLGEDRPVTAARFLGHVPGPPGSKAEGLAIEEETADAYKVVIVYDSAKNGSPTLFSVKK